MKSCLWRDDKGSDMTKIARTHVWSMRHLLSMGTLTRVGVILPLVLGALLAGCRTPPDMRPFADATSQFTGAIKIAGRTVAAEIDAMTAKWPPDQRATTDKIIRQFNQQWAQRNALSDALLEYSVSLSAIAQAGEQGEQSARALADAFQKLCGAIAVAMPPAAAAVGAINIGAQLYGRFARDYAAKTLGEGMKKLQPSIDETATVLSDSLVQLETSLDAIRDQNAQNIEDEEIDGAKVSTRRHNAKMLTSRRADLLKMLGDGNGARDALRAGLLKAADPTKQRELHRLGALSSDITSELAAVEISLKSETETLAVIDTRKAADRDRLTTEMVLVHTVRRGLGDWAAAHARLAAAALEKKPLHVEDLVQTALDIRALTKTIRTTQKE